MAQNRHARLAKERLPLTMVFGLLVGPSVLVLKAKLDEGVGVLPSSFNLLLVFLRFEREGL